MQFAAGHSMAMIYNTDPLSLLYIALSATWSTVLTLGSIYLIMNRTRQCIRLRNIALSLSAVAVLHVYWILCLLAYMLQGYFPCGVEFWIMSVYLPLGVALFHAANTQLLQVAMLQKQYLHAYTPLSGSASNNSRLQVLHRYASVFGSKDKVKRTIGYISCFMVLQLMLTSFIFFISRKFHSSFGVTTPDFGTYLDDDGQCQQQEITSSVADCDAAARFACRRGWEWIPSMLWQFFWAWIYAPYLLWNLRGIKDVHGWRTQTIICCLAGLPATPMWLTALYVPQMRTINKYYIPPMWFAPSIFLIEAMVVFVPCYSVLVNKRLERNTETIIRNWQGKRHNSASSLGDNSTLVEAASSHQGSTLSARSVYCCQVYTMEALETTLRQNHQPLLHFASLRDFSGENISFLVHVMNWKFDWLPMSPSRTVHVRKSRTKGMHGECLRRHQFEQALNIYVSFVSLKYSDYSINLSSSQYKQLEDIFDGAASLIHGPLHSHMDTVTPFNDFWTMPYSATSSNNEKASSKDAISTTSMNGRHGPENSTENILPAECESMSTVQGHKINKVGQKLPEYVPIPSAFGVEVFDAAQESIKYMVLTNTWCKFVREREHDANKKNLVNHIREILA